MTFCINRLLIIVLIDILQIKVERLSFCERCSQHPSSLRGGFFINPLEQLVIWSFEITAYLGETRTLAVNWVPMCMHRLKCGVHGKQSSQAVIAILGRKWHEEYTITQNSTIYRGIPQNDWPINSLVQSLKCQLALRQIGGTTPTLTTPFVGKSSISPLPPA